MIDPARSELGFSVRHLMVATVSGRFTSFEGVITTDRRGPTGATGTVRTASIDTGDAIRDEHLRDASFFDVERNPQIRFASSRFERIEDERFRVIGDLTVGGVTGQLVLEAAFGHDAACCGLRIGARGELMRSAFGLAWRRSLEASGALVSDRVKVVLDALATPAAGTAVTAAPVRAGPGRGGKPG